MFPWEGYYYVDEGGELGRIIHELTVVKKVMVLGVRYCTFSLF